MDCYKLLYYLTSKADQSVTVTTINLALMILHMPQLLGLFSRNIDVRAYDEQTGEPLFLTKFVSSDGPGFRENGSDCNPALFQGHWCEP
jgi:hypothetical protein